MILIRQFPFLAQILIQSFTLFFLLFLCYVYLFLVSKSEELFCKYKFSINLMEFQVGFFAKWHINRRRLFNAKDILLEEL